MLDELHAWQCERTSSVGIPSVLPLGTTNCASFCVGTGTIRVYRSANRSAVYPIAFFRNTLLMNYLSFDHICIAYPHLTFGRRGVVTTCALEDVEYGLTEIDRSYGYDIAEEFSCDTSTGVSGCMVCPVCPRLLRTMRDVRCSFIRLTTQPFQLVRHNVEWRMGTLRCVSCCGRSRKLKVNVRDAGNTWI